MISIGIDPGITGAIAVLDEERIEVHDMPTVQSGKRRQLDIHKVASLLETECWSDHRRSRGLSATIERQQAMPKQGVSSTFSIGYQFGALEALLVALRVSYSVVQARAWKIEMCRGMPKGKDTSLVVARRLFPDADLGRRKDAGRAEALLIAEYGRRRG